MFGHINVHAAAHSCTMTSWLSAAHPDRRQGVLRLYQPPYASNAASSNVPLEYGISHCPTSFEYQKKASTVVQVCQDDATSSHTASTGPHNCTTILAPGASLAQEGCHAPMHVPAHPADMYLPLNPSRTSPQLGMLITACAYCPTFHRPAQFPLGLQYFVSLSIPQHQR